MLDVPRHVVELAARLLAGHRRQTGTPKGWRALGPFRQAVLILRWFRDRACVHCLARDAGISQAAGYRYLHEGSMSSPVRPRTCTTCWTAAAGMA